MRGAALSSQATMQESSAAPTVRASSSQICSIFFARTSRLSLQAAAPLLCAPISDPRPMQKAPRRMYAVNATKGVPMRRFVRKLLRSQDGQGLSEYLIIVALVAVAAIGVVTVFGRDIRELFSGTTDSLAGNQANNTARKATVKSSKSLKNFGKYNAASGD